MKIRSFITTILLFWLLFFSTGMEVKAETYTGQATDEITYTYDDETDILILSGTGYVNNDSGWLDEFGEWVKSVVVEEGISGLADEVFSDMYDMESISLPSTLTYMGKSVFEYCTNLKSITIPANVEQAEYTFQDSRIQEICFMDGMTVIPEAICYGMEFLRKITLPNTVEEIEYYAFARCPQLYSVTFPASTRVIGPQSFIRCYGLQSVQFNEGLTTIGYAAFNDCVALTEIKLPSTLVETSESFANSGVEKVVFPAGITAIPSYFCSDMVMLESITIPSTVKEIGKSAFFGCEQLKNVTLPAGLKTMGQYAFQNCQALEEITLPASLTSYPEAFYKSGLRKVTFAEGSTIVSEKGFYQCSQLNTVVFAKSIKEIGTNAFSKCYSLKVLKLPWYLETLREGSLDAINLKKVYMYQKVKTIENPFLEEMDLLTIYGKKGTYAQTFAKANGIPFKTCKVPALKGVTYTKGNLKYTVISDAIGGKGTVCVTGMVKAKKKVEIPAKVKLEGYKYKVVKIGKKAFFKQSKLKTVVIKSKTITSIGKKAFKGIHKKAVVKVPKAKYEQYKKMLKKAGVKGKRRIVKL